MKLKLSFKTKTKKGKEVVLKFNLAPSKHIGFINFVNLAITHNKDVTLALEKTSITGERKEIDIFNNFKFEKI